MAESSFDESGDSPVPEFQPELVSQVARWLDLSSVELVSSFFTKADRAPIPEPVDTWGRPKVTTACAWEFDEEQLILGSLLRFEAYHDDGVEDGFGYFAGAEIRVTYQAQEECPPLSEEALAVFAYWNGVLNTWPYWRELMSSLTRRSGLVAQPIPLFKFPSVQAREGRAKKAPAKKAAAKKAAAKKAAPQ